MTMNAAHTARAPASYFEGWDHLEFWVGNARAFTGSVVGANAISSLPPRVDSLLIFVPL